MISSIGVIGGGQLGRMFALDAKRMGYEVITLDPVPHSPSAQVSDEQIIARYDDLDAIEELGRKTDVVTYEFENIAIESVRHLEALGYAVSPSSAVLAITQDRLLEKRFVRDCGIATTPFASVEPNGDVATAIDAVGLPAIIKTTRGGYDGKGQWYVSDVPAARAAKAAANGAELICERFVSFERELSIICTRSQDGAVVTYPLGENEHDAGILAMTLAPARVSETVVEEAQRIARRIAEGLRIVGTFCVEFFLTAQGDLLVNEIAPRPHNSGHYTIDATPCSQYEQHVRAICGLPLSSPHLFTSAIMVNILGDGMGNHLQGIEKLLRDPSIVLHLYGKKHAVARRKMGHFTMLVDGEITRQAVQHARAARSLLSWSQADRTLGGAEQQ
ncbi:MAG: 5-(carboxyamino)imidazole ribonucleotide synthase [Candidatus Eremiobacteraeota bacterium]|nr:5-(carboxyamino)imidazole ribonucleotide synthase [Candidatus Eremiobacteraeota bacterium]